MLIDKSNIKCVKCGLKTGLCDCWVKCPISGCSWSFEKGGKCGNTNHQ